MRHKVRREKGRRQGIVEEKLGDKSRTASTRYVCTGMGRQQKEKGHSHGALLSF
jgi:hypothetical protein